MYLMLLLVTLVMLPWMAAAEWQPSGCPELCICHEVWVDTLETRLNAIDCAGTQPRLDFTVYRPE